MHFHDEAKWLDFRWGSAHLPSCPYPLLYDSRGDRSKCPAEEDRGCALVFLRGQQGHLQSSVVVILRQALPRAPDAAPHLAILVIKRPRGAHVSGVLRTSQV